MKDVIYQGALLAALLAAQVLVQHRDQQDKVEVATEAEIVTVKTIGIPMPMNCDATMRVSVSGIIERETCWNRETAARKWQAP